MATVVEEKQITRLGTLIEPLLSLAKTIRDLMQRSAMQSQALSSLWVQDIGRPSSTSEIGGLYSL